MVVEEERTKKRRRRRRLYFWVLDEKKNMTGKGKHNDKERNKKQQLTILALDHLHASMVDWLTSYDNIIISIYEYIHTYLYMYICTYAFMLSMTNDNEHKLRSNIECKTRRKVPMIVMIHWSDKIK